MPDVNRDADTDPSENGTPDPTESAPTGRDEEGPTATEFEAADQKTITSGDFNGEATAADVDPFTEMFDTGATRSTDPSSATGETPAEEGEAPTGEDAEGDTPAGEQEPQSEGEGAEDAEEESREEQRKRWMDPDAFAEKTGIEAEDPDEAAQKVNRLKDQVAGYTELEQVIEERPGFQEMLHEMSQGKTAAEAAGALEGVETQAPDPNESPEQYAEWKAAQKRKEKERQSEREQQRERQEEIQKKQRRMESEFESVVDRHEDIGAEELGTTLKRLTVTAPDARFRAEDLNTLAKGLKHDERIEQAKEKAYQKGREEALQEVRGDGSVEAGDGLPDMRTGGGASEDDQTHEADVDEGVGALFGPSEEEARSIHDRV